MSIYDYLHPDHPLNAFISSLCDVDFAKTSEEYQKRKKYCTVRRELQLLLESTHLFIVYNFDEEYASSMSTRDQYIHYLDTSDLVVFLIDNKDGISDGVRKEYKEAIEQNKKCYYIICNHDDVPKTEIQEKMESSPTDEPRFKSVKEFEKAAEVAYKSIMSDLVFHYQLKDERQKRVDATKKISQAAVAINSYSIVDTADPDVFGGGDESRPQESDIKPGAGEDEHDNLEIHKLDTNKDLQTSQIKCSIYLDKKLYEAPKELATYLYDCMVFGGLRTYESRIANKTRVTPIVAGALQFLSTLIGRSAFDSNSFDELSKIITEKQDDVLKPIVIERLLALKSYHSGNVSEAIDHIHNALKIAINFKNIPEWVLNDIAVDLRNMISINAKIENNLELGFGIGNEGQKILDESSETVYYPLIDRSENYLYERVVERYEKNYLQSPYTITFGSSLDRVFKFIADIYWIALLNGSFTHVEITSQRLITALRMLVNTYDDHLPVVELFRLILIRNDKVKESIGDILRTYHGDTDILNAKEAESLYQSIKWMQIDTQRYQAEYEFVANFSCYCDDDLFYKCIEQPLRNSLAWAKNSKRIYLNDEDKFRFYDGLINRGQSGKMVEFAITLLENTKSPETAESLKRDVCKHLRNIDYSEIDEVQVDKLLSYLIPLFSSDETVGSVNESKDNTSDNSESVGDAGFTSDESNVENKHSDYRRSLTMEFKDNQYLIGVLIQIALSAPKYKDGIKKVIGAVSEDYAESFNLEIAVSEYKKDKNIDDYRDIKSYLDAGKANAELANNGTLTEGVNYYEVIRNIIENTNVKLTKIQIEEIIQYALDFLSVTKQRVSQRVTCCQVLSLLICRYKEDFDWKTLSKTLEQKKNEYTEAESDLFFHDSPVQLQCAYTLLLVFGGHGSNDELISILSSIGNEQEYVRIRCLDILTEALKIDSGGKLRKAVVNTIGTFALFSSGSHERDVKYNCVKCLIELTRYKVTRDLALRQLMLLMDSGMAEIRLATVARIKDSKLENNHYAAAIMGKARVDHHYLVRKAAEE